jgi:hypothetical protein
MQRCFLLLVALLALTACGSEALQPARATAEAVIEQVAPTVRALVPTPVPTLTPDPRYSSTLSTALIACFAPGCAAEVAIILPAGTKYNDTGPDSGTWRFIEIEGGGQVWVLRAKLTTE